MSEMTLDSPGAFFSRFLSRFLHRVQYGDTPSSPADYSNHRLVSNPRLVDLRFQVHAGPMKDVITDAKALHRSLFIYVYCPENPVSVAMDHLFQSPLVASLIATKCVFYAVSSTTADGYSAITGSDFTSLPLFLIAAPHGESLKNCRITWTFQGSLNEPGLLAALESLRAPPAAADPIRAEQDLYFMQAVQEDVRRTEERANEELQQRAEEERVEREFANLPAPPPSEKDVVSVKFRFKDNTEQLRVFPRSGSVAMLYSFVRKFEYPREFVLKSGFPVDVLPESDAILGEVFRERNVLVHVAAPE